jgi:hypothetical protein
MNDHQQACHLPRGTAGDDAGAVGAGHTGDLRQGAGGRAGCPTGPTIGHVGEEVNAGAAATVLAAHTVLAFLTCRGPRGAGKLGVAECQQQQEVQQEQQQHILQTIP